MNSRATSNRKNKNLFQHHRVCGGLGGVTTSPLLRWIKTPRFIGMWPNGKALDLGSRFRWFDSIHSDQGRKISKLTVLLCNKKPICAISVTLTDHKESKGKRIAARLLSGAYLQWLLVSSTMLSASYSYKR